MVNKLFIVSRYKEDYLWIEEYTNNYLIYNKGEAILDNPHIINIENIGGNQRDIAKFAYENYDSLPDVMIFCQCFPFDHCTKSVFDKLIQNTKLTSLEYYGANPANAFEGRTLEGEFLEVNNNWYISAHNSSNNIQCKYTSFDEFMNKYFEDYNHVDYIRFAPGSQYLITPKEILQYPRHFWKRLMEELTERNSTEAHIVERSIWYILSGTYKLRKEYSWQN